MKNVPYNWIYIGFGLIRSLVSLPDPEKTVMRSNLHLKREVCSEESDSEVFLMCSVTFDLHGPCEGEERKRSMKNITLILPLTDTHTAKYQGRISQCIWSVSSRWHLTSLSSSRRSVQGGCVPCPGMQHCACVSRESPCQPGHLDGASSAAGLSMWSLRLPTSIWYFQQDQSLAQSNDSSACFRTACAA